MSVIITALIIVAVILANVIVSALSAKYLWYIDMTKESIFTVSDACFDLLDETFKDLDARESESGEDKSFVTIKFCDMQDNLMKVGYSKYVLTTALELAAEYPDRIGVEFINIYENPSAVSPYKTSVSTSIINTDVIIAGSGGEYRLYDIEDFFMISSGATSPFAYCGDKRFSSAILAVTQVSKPVVGMLMGHGETFKDAALGYLFEEAGYRIEVITDLVGDGIPEDCRMLVSYQPTSDFRSLDDGISDVSEIQIIDDFLAKDNRSLMVFMSPDCPTLPNIEKYLAQWGIAFDRTAEGESKVVSESASNALTSGGYTFLAQYEKYGMGASLTSELRKMPVPQKTVFKNAMPLRFADAYDVETVADEDSGETFTYAYKAMGAYSRQVFKVFSSGADAVAMAGGREVERASAQNTFPLMLLSIAPKTEQEDNNGWFSADQSSYVLACGSADFATEAILHSDVYGNSEVLRQAFYQMGKDAVPSYVPYVPFADLSIDSLTAERANRITVWLTVLPPVLFFGAGVWVLVRRKYR
ncbi:MAG: Gldg family protein [Clostridia bacterium]|nr:Gldg family protein [Clostridia bacterium]